MSAQRKRGDKIVIPRAELAAAVQRGLASWQTTTSAQLLPGMAQALVGHVVASLNRAANPKPPAPANPKSAWWNRDD